MVRGKRRLKTCGYQKKKFLALHELKITEAGPHIMYAVKDFA